MNGDRIGNGENRARNGHVLVWEQSGFDEEERPVQKKRGMA
jgi:hypothetical protein